MLLIAIPCVSAASLLCLTFYSAVPFNWGALLGGSAYLSSVLLIGWGIFVGLFTGRFPTSSGSEDRRASPFWFWTTICIYGATFLLLIGLLLAMALQF